MLKSLSPKFKINYWEDRVGSDRQYLPVRVRAAEGYTPTPSKLSSAWGGIYPLILLRYTPAKNRGRIPSY
jgi:hypothetical protein